MSYEVNEDAYYTEDHEWVTVDDGIATEGLADFAQDELGDLVFFELPAEGDEFEQGEALGVVESIKAVADFYAGVSGEVIEVNEDLLDEPEIINEDPYGTWIVKIDMDDEGELDNLFDADSYQEELLD